MKRLMLRKSANRLTLSTFFSDCYNPPGLTGGQEVAGSNPVVPTSNREKADGNQAFLGR